MTTSMKPVAGRHLMRGQVGFVHRLSAYICLVLGLGMGCSRDSSTSGSPGVAPGSPVATAAPAPAGAAGSISGNGKGANTPANRCSTMCSADLKDVLDCNGNLMSSCGTGEACLNGACSTQVCDAAEAADSSVGCEFWAIKPPALPKWVPENTSPAGCFAVFIANTWDTPVKINAFRNGTYFQDFVYIPRGNGNALQYDPYDPFVGLPAGEVAVLFLSHIPNKRMCPKPAAFTGELTIDGTGKGHSIRITTDKPVAAYSIFPFGGGQSAVTSASLLLPTHAWHTNYLAINPYQEMLNSLTIVANEDGTDLQMRPNGGTLIDENMVWTTPTDGVAKYTLNAGEYLQLSNSLSELTGSPIQSNKPVGLWGVSYCFNVPRDKNYCDSAHQQIPPVSAWGHQYVGVRYRNRSSAIGTESPPWRLVGAVDGTQLTWAPSIPAGAPTSLGAGETAEFQATGPFVVQSQDAAHPFYMAQYMTGSEYIQSDLGEGDPEWVNVVSSQQYLKRYVFFADPTYPETNLVIVRRRDPATNRFADVELDCAGVVTGWKVVGAFEYTRIDLSTGNFRNVGNCSTGRREISSTAPFGATVWGWGKSDTHPSTRDVSYGYPAGMGTRAINNVTVAADPNYRLVDLVAAPPPPVTVGPSTIESVFNPLGRCVPADETVERRRDPTQWCSNCGMCAGATTAIDLSGSMFSPEQPTTGKLRILGSAPDGVQIFVASTPPNRASLLSDTPLSVDIDPRVQPLQIPLAVCTARCPTGGAYTVDVELAFEQVWDGRTGQGPTRVAARVPLSITIEPSDFWTCYGWIVVLVIGAIVFLLWAYGFVHPLKFPRSGSGRSANFPHKRYAVSVGELEEMKAESRAVPLRRYALPKRPWYVPDQVVYLSLLGDISRNRNGAVVAIELRRVNGRFRAWFVPLDGRRWILARYQYGEWLAHQDGWLKTPDGAAMQLISGPTGAELKLGFVYVPVGGSEDDPSPPDVDDFALLFE